MPAWSQARLKQPWLTNAVAHPNKTTSVRHNLSMASGNFFKALMFVVRVAVGCGWVWASSGHSSAVPVGSFSSSAFFFGHSHLLLRRDPAFHPTYPNGLLLQQIFWLCVPSKCAPGCVVEGVVHRRGFRPDVYIFYS